ncbi:MAG: type I-E CRISPR-associated protein Cas6/Cse3/CasE [Blastocatellia bacterium]|nr:type I-E CRISPR-associated protein Cas6/Cse3/CasE [Blastocatellia bacterium]
MYLSKLSLNPRSRAVRRDLADCHELHRTLLSAFPQAQTEAARDEFGLLYRIDASLRTGAVTAIVQSQIAPNWHQLPDDYLLDIENNPACKAVDGAYEALREGRQLVFRLRANPTRKIDTKTGPDGKKNNGKRVEIRGEENQIAWLHRKADMHGFRLIRLRVNPGIVNVRVAPENKVFGWRGGNGEDKDANGGARRRLTFGAVLFEGLLEITDMERFKQTLADGIGSGKAYGFGLLSIAPARA